MVQLVDFQHDFRVEKMVSLLAFVQATEEEVVAGAEAAVEEDESLKWSRRVQSLIELADAIDGLVEC